MRLLFVLIAPKNNFDWQKNLLLTTYRTCDVKNPKSDIFFAHPLIVIVGTVNKIRPILKMLKTFHERFDSQ